MRGPKVHSFIVKLWLDEPGDKAAAGGWHGYITHVPSGKRRYLQSLYDILSFVKSTVGKINSDVARPARDRRWLSSWRRKKE